MKAPSALVTSQFNNSNTCCCLSTYCIPPHQVLPSSLSAPCSFCCSHTASSVFLQHARHRPAPGPLHKLFSP